MLNRLKNDQPDKTISQLISSSFRSLQKLNVLVDDVLNANRLTDNSVKIKKAFTNLGTLVNEVWNDIVFNEPRELIIEGDKNLGANVDQHRIEQVIVNFINNAIKYAPLSKQIHVFIQEEPGKVKVSVKDTGPGIPHEQLANVFDRYWRADRSGNAYSGLGMGLYICSEIIKKHGGEIGVHSILGQGSIFWFSIPK